MITAILWENSWRIAGMAESLPFPSLEEAADELARALGETRGRLRLIYQPELLQTVAITAAKAGRARLRAELEDQYPALAKQDCIWSHEPVLPSGETFATLVYFEREPGLRQLVRHLKERGFTVESAWPLATYLQALPVEWSEDGAFTIAAMQYDCCSGFRHAPDGSRSAPSWRGKSSLAEVGAWLGEILAKNPNESVLLVGDAGLTKELAQHTSILETADAGWLTWTEALQREATIARKHPAQLLPATPIVTADRAAMAASFFFLAGAVGASSGYARNWIDARINGTADAAKAQMLRAEIDHLRANAADIAALKSVLDGSKQTRLTTDFLAQISATVPAQAVVDSIRVADSRFTISGYFAPNAPAGTFEGWRAKLVDARWTIQGNAATSGAFTLQGNFTT